jgi:hypothetical protein
MSVVGAVLAFSTGLLAFLLLPTVAQSLPRLYQLKIGQWCYSSAMRSYGEIAIVWRELGGPELKPLKVDDEEGVARVILSSGTLGDDKDLAFEDIDRRLHRLHGRPLAVVPEIMPVAVDAEMAEMGHWFDQKGSAGEFDAGADRVDPYLPMSDQLRAAHPFDTAHLAPASIGPQQIQTAKDMMEAAYSKYGGGVGAVESAATLIAFAGGAGVVAGLFYVRDQVVAGGGDVGGLGNQTVGIPAQVDPALLADLMVLLA